MQPIKRFKALQETDSALDADRKQFADNKAAMQPSATLQSLAKQVKALSGHVAHWRKERSKRDASVAELAAKIARLEKKLYGGRIKDAREQVAMQQNIESLKRHLATLEEAALEAMLELEEHEQNLEATQARFAAQKAQWQEQKARLEKEQEALVAHARKLKNKRTQLAAAMPPADLARYESLRKKLGGLAVVKIQGRSCGGCGANLPTATVQKVHESKLATCPICRRLLYD